MGEQNLTTKNHEEGLIHGHLCVFFIAVIGAFKVRFYSFVFWAVILGVESHDAEPETIRTLTCQSFSVDLCVMHQQF
jgi:hypothetical protein